MDGRYKCKIHNRDRIIMRRLEIPANMNGAPRYVCPECLEERAELAEKRVKELEKRAEKKAEESIAEIEERIMDLP